MNNQRRLLPLALCLLLAAPWACRGGGCAGRQASRTDSGPRAVERPGNDEGGPLCQTDDQRRCVRQLVALLSSYLETGDRGLFKEFNAWIGDKNGVPRAAEELRFKQEMLVVLGLLLQGRQPIYPGKEHKIVASFVLPSLKQTTRLKELLQVLGPRKPGPGGVTGDYATAYQQIMGGFFTLEPDLERHLEKSRIVELKPGMMVADIGCGVGSQATVLARRVGDTGRIYAVDISQRVVDFVAHLRTHVPDGERIVPVRSRRNDTTLAAGSLDLAMVHGINFLFAGEAEKMPEHAEGFFRSVRKALKPGGLFLVRSYQKTDRLERYITARGFAKLKRYNARPKPRGNNNTMIVEDFYVLFRSTLTP